MLMKVLCVLGMEQLQIHTYTHTHTHTDMHLMHPCKSTDSCKLICKKVYL